MIPITLREGGYKRKSFGDVWIKIWHEQLKKPEIDNLSLKDMLLLSKYLK